MLALLRPISHDRRVCCFPLALLSLLEYMFVSASKMHQYDPLGAESRVARYHVTVSDYH